MKMIIELKRDFLYPLCTIGTLTVDGLFVCYTLEDTVREVDGVDVKEWKIPGRTAIPRGEYEVVLSMSNRFKKILPEVLNVPGFAGIRIHTGNTQKDTEGCILVGMVNRIISIGDSVAALKKLQPMIENAIKNKEKVTIKLS